MNGVDRVVKSRVQDGERARLAERVRSLARGERLGGDGIPFDNRVVLRACRRRARQRTDRRQRERTGDPDARDADASTPDDAMLQ